MAARTGLTDLLEILRGMADAGTADYSIGTADYWDDDHLQDVLDRHRTDVIHEQLDKIQDWNGGTVRYLEYVSQFDNYEKTTGGTAIFYVEHSTGADVGTANYSTDYYRGRITFGADTGGSTLYLTGRSYDLQAAAADVWRHKAANAAKMYDFSTDNHRFARSQYMKHCLEMSNFYSKKSKPSTTVMTRSDVNANALK